MSKLRVGLLFGGRSVEHEVSIASASFIFKALDPSRYEVLPILVGHDGGWRIGALGMLPEDEDDERDEQRSEDDLELKILPDELPSSPVRLSSPVRALYCLFVTHQP